MLPDVRYYPTLPYKLRTRIINWRYLGGATDSKNENFHLLLTIALDESTDRKDTAQLAVVILKTTFKTAHHVDTKSPCILIEARVTVGIGPAPTAQALRNKSFEVHEEVHCIASEGCGIRRADIVALDKTNSKGFMLDPTVRFEMNQTQPS
ncbi:hypothetical protein ANN_21967 [Periplaneta americana]|uniref:Uncharacterized protein n=1 Tax=Periplaneta americana TaxID=6978 RepID=A0ABQ8S6V1_PERAM|nr:hypothetical protein ANN_21967 [Periplaneta americana]